MKFDVIIKLKDGREVLIDKYLDLLKTDEEVAMLATNFKHGFENNATFTVDNGSFKYDEIKSITLDIK